MKKVFLSVVSILALAGASQGQPDKTETFICPQGSFITSLSGSSDKLVNSLAATCSDSKNTKSELYGSNQGTKFSLPYDQGGITKVIVHQDRFVNSLGYDGITVGGPMTYRVVEFVDINGCAVVGFDVTYDEKVLKHVKFRFACVNQAITIPVQRTLKNPYLTPRNCEMCLSDITVKNSARVNFIARVLRICHPRFRNIQNAYAVAQSLENGALAGDTYSTYIVKAIVKAGNQQLCTKAVKNVAATLSVGKYTGTARDSAVFQKAYVNNAGTMPYNILMQQANQSGQSDYCDETAYESLPYCDEVSGPTEPVMPYSYGPTMNQAAQQQINQLLPYCDEIGQDLSAQNSSVPMSQLGQQQPTLNNAANQSGQYQPTMNNAANQYQPTLNDAANQFGQYQPTMNNAANQYQPTSNNAANRYKPTLNNAANQSGQYQPTMNNAANQYQPTMNNAANQYQPTMNNAANQFGRNEVRPLDNGLGQGQYQPTNFQGAQSGKPTEGQRFSPRPLEQGAHEERPNQGQRFDALPLVQGANSGKPTQYGPQGNTPNGIYKGIQNQPDMDNRNGPTHDLGANASPFNGTDRSPNNMNGVNRPIENMPPFSGPQMNNDSPSENGNSMYGDNGPSNDDSDSLLPDEVSFNVFDNGNMVVTKPTGTTVEMPCPTCVDDIPADKVNLEIVGNGNDQNSNGLSNIGYKVDTDALTQSSTGNTGASFFDGIDLYGDGKLNSNQNDLDDQGMSQSESYSSSSAKAEAILAIKSLLEDSACDCTENDDSDCNESNEDQDIENGDDDDDDNEDPMENDMDKKHREHDRDIDQY